MSKIDDLRVKYSSLKPDSFNRLVNGDETPTKKYAEFLLKTWSNRANNACVRTIDNLIDLVKKFDGLLPYIIEKDIYHKSYFNINVLKNVVNVAEEEKDSKTFDRADHVEVLYEDDETIETWTFDLDKFDKGPISVDIKYKAGADKAIKLRAKEAKQQKKIARQMKKINNRGK